MADQKSRGGKKAGHEKQPQGKRHQATEVTAARGTAPQARRPLRGRDSMRQKKR